MRTIFLTLLAGLIGCVGLAGMATAKGPPPKVEDALKFRPQHGDVEYDIPEPKTIKQCKITVVSEGKATGWVVTGPAGQVIRKFMDVDGNDQVDQWSYYKSGLEVYRDIDSNGNGIADQARWMNLGGLRWGIDKNEDGKIDKWKRISAEEVSRIAVRALVTQDASLLAPLLVTKEDLAELGIKGPLETKLLGLVADPAAKLRKNIAKSKIIHARTTFLRFDASPPGVVLAEIFKTPNDLFLYENVMAMVDYGKADQPGLVQVGELVRVGDIWKMTGIPMPLEGNSVELAPGPIMFDPQNAGGAGSSGEPEVPAVPEDVQKLVEQLRKLMEKSPGPKATQAAVDKYYREVENVLIELVNKSKTDDERVQWTRQLLDTILSGVQSQRYKKGVARLRELETDISKNFPAKSSLIASARYRVIVAEYFDAMLEAKDDKDAQQNNYEKWLKDLEEFLEKNPKGDEVPDAALQLAVQLEIGGKSDKAKGWYEKVVSDFKESPVAAKAAGALKRLELNGKALALAGTSLGGGTIDVSRFRGKILAVYFWDTNSIVALQDLPPLKSLYDEYRGQGFEIIGVNLDVEKAPVETYLTQHAVKWPQIHEPGGLESAPAKAFGIFVVPTLFIVDADGKVANRNATVADVKAALAEAFKKK